MKRRAADFNTQIYKLESIIPQIRIFGRYTIKEGCIALDWPGSGLSFNFFGTGMVISFGSLNFDQPCYIKAYVDGQFQRFAISDSREKIIFENLSPKRHRVELKKVTESVEPLLFESVQLLGKGSKLLAPMYEKIRKIEFIGDSITAGYGALAPSGETAFNTYQQDVTASYSLITANILNAKARVICWSGKGLVCDCNGTRENTFSEFYRYASLKGKEPWDFTGEKADVVVINAGTNDVGGNISDEEFSNAAEEFIAFVRSKNPNAHIIYYYGLMNDRYARPLKAVIKKMSETDKMLHFLFVKSINSFPGETGAAGHPNLKAHHRAANILVKKIKIVTGWS